MNYELAKKLKDAGFPQGESLDAVLVQGTAMAYLRESKPDDELLERYQDALEKLKALYEDDEEYVYVPSLSELINACEKDFITLTRLDGGTWMARGGNANFPEGSCYQEGSTPEEAVANLWLALNA